MKAVPGHRYLYRRGDRLIFRRGIPKFAASAFNGRSEVQVSLRTSNLAEARHLLPRENARFEKIIADFSGKSAPAEIAARRSSVGQEAMEAAVRQIFKERLELVVEFDPMDAGSVARVLDLRRSVEGLRENVKMSRKLGSSGWSQTTIWAADAVQDRFGWHLEGPQRSSLLRLIAQGQIEAAEQQLQIMDGEPRKVIDDTFAAERFRLDEQRQTLRRA